MALARIRFGTDGWRAVLADGFTLAEVRRVAAAAGLVWRGQAGRGATVLVAHDTRFLGERFAAAAAGALAGTGLDARLCARPLPTPALSFAVRAYGATGGIMVTASHNPPEWNGLKLKGAHGGPVGEEFTAEVEAALPDEPPRDGEPGQPFDPMPAYVRRLGELCDLAAIRSLREAVICDPMHGSGAGVLSGILGGAAEIRATPDPYFGGGRPEPVGERLRALQDAVAGLGREACGLATDGDADRIGAVDEAGEIVDAQRIFGLLLRHLAGRRGLRGTVAKTYAVTDMVDRLAAAFGLPLRTLPIGYKHVTAVALREPLLIGGEEAGGIGFGLHLPERDGILCGLLILEAMATEHASLRELVADLLARFGPSVYGRMDVPLPEEARAAVPAAIQTPPSAIGGESVTSVERLDGIKARLGEHGWVLWRASGTEPLLRVYAETDDAGRLHRILTDAAAACGAASV